MNFSLVICTYCRPLSVLNLLKSVEGQVLKPLEIIIIDGSPHNATENAIAVAELFDLIKYVRVPAEQRGLTRQRNVGIDKSDPSSEILVFLDDDVILEPFFLKQLISTFDDTEIIGADGLIINENSWYSSTGNKNKLIHQFDGYELPLSARNRVRARFGLYPFSYTPGTIPPFGHGKTSLPPTGKIYEVEHIMGGITAYRSWLFTKIRFSTFFEGYGLYEDFDFSVRASRYGKLVTNTAARLEHHHHTAGRPDGYKFGKMVVWNGWYVWRLKHPKPGLKNIFKWHAITLLLAFVRLTNCVYGKKREEAFNDFRGRMYSWIKLFYSKPNTNFN
jgi:GT2 family glycosyltransferase